MDRGKIIRVGNTVQKARERLRALRFNTRRNAHRSLRWFHVEKRSPTAHAKCITPSGII